MPWSATFADHGKLHTNNPKTQTYRPGGTGTPNMVANLKAII